MGALALSTFSFWLLWLYAQESKTRGSVSRATWIVVIWAAIYGSRPVTEWLTGVGLESASQQSRDEGNPVEAFVTFSLMLAGLLVLARRNVRVAVIIRENSWLFVFYLFWFMSIGWSDYPLITFKRLFKELGNIVMVLVVLTDHSPTQAMKSIFSRVAYLLIPLSIIFIRWYPNLGRIFAGYDGSLNMWVGVTMHKNALGVVAFVGAIFVLWDLIDSQRENSKKIRKTVFASRVLVLCMCWYLLLYINSATSLICALLGTTLLMLLRLRSVRQNPGRLESIGLACLALFVVLDSALKLKEAFVESLGRDMTLTSRTEIWPILLSQQDSPILGVGFNTFWTGDRLVKLPGIMSSMVQAHNGYLETYLNGGLVGVGLLVVLLLWAYMRIRRQLISGAPDSIVRLVVLLLAIVFNNSEATFTKMGLLWLVTLLAITQYPTPRVSTRKVAFGTIAQPATSLSPLSERL